MTAQPMTINAFASKLTALKQARFSGRLFLKGTLGQEWTLYFYLGRILYATGGTHPVRRWQRHLGIHCSNVSLNQLDLPTDISEISSEVSKNCREYFLLCLLLKQQKIDREQVVKIIQGIVLEVLFDVTQEIPKALQIKQENPLAPQLLLIDAEQAIAKTQEIWQAWKIAKISDVLPNRAPSIKQPEQLQQKTSPTVYKSLTFLLNGQRTLRDIAVQTKRNVAEVTRSLLPYLETGLVELSDISDLANPLAQASSGLPVKNPPTSSSSGKTPAQVATRKPLIACVDDSPLVCKNMEKILTSAGYQFLAVPDSMRAIATLLNRKPHIIFLDLVMPNTNGYEICTQLRKVSAFRDTPIIILTGNDGIIDRVRAKVVGASDFMGKPVDAEKVLAVTNKYLKHLKNSSPVVS
ncbi:MAG: response regulator [Cyanobacteriota bacterium]